MKTTPIWSKALGLSSVVVAGAAGIGIGVTALFTAFSDPLPGPSGRNSVPMVSAPLTAGLISLAVCLALGSRIAFPRIGRLLLGAAIAGFIVSSLLLLVAFRGLQTD
jgi:hypothetical protein